VSNNEKHKYCWMDIDDDGDGHCFFGSGFDSREDAVRAALDSLTSEIDFQTARQVPIKVSRFLNLDHVIESAKERFGDMADYFMTAIGNEEESELRNLIDHWATKHDLHPTFFDVADVQVHLRGAE
jgi:hypothetical protein